MDRSTTVSCIIPHFWSRIYIASLHLRHVGWTNLSDTSKCVLTLRNFADARLRIRPPFWSLVSVESGANETKPWYEPKTFQLATSIHWDFLQSIGITSMVQSTYCKSISKNSILRLSQWAATLWRRFIRSTKALLPCRHCDSLSYTSIDLSLCLESWPRNVTSIPICFHMMKTELVWS